MTRHARVGPLSVVAACLLPVCGALAIDTGVRGAFLVLAEMVALSWLARDLRHAPLRLGLGVVAAASVAVSTWLYGGHHLNESLGAACRIMYLVLPAALLMPRVRPSELGDHLAQRLHLPPRTVVAAVVALQRLDDLARQWQLVQRARRSRGYGPDGGPVRRLRSSAGSAFALLVVSMRRTGTTATAMDSRGFAHASQRTWAEAAAWTAGDWLVLTLGGALAVLPWLVR